MNEQQLTPEQYQQMIEQELQEADRLRGENYKLKKSMSSMYEINPEDNLVKWQLNLEEEKDRIYHLLKGERKGYDEKGGEVWIEPLSTDSAILNEYGIDYIMGVMEAFLNRNIILSDYDPEEIAVRVRILGRRLTFDIFNDYEKMGMNTEDKRKKFPILVMKILMNIEAAYKRALYGRERESLRKIMSVSQNEPLGMMRQMYPQQMQMSQGQRKFKFYNPMTWGG